MAEETQNASLDIEWVETDEKPFKPEKTHTVEAVLEPEEQQEKTYYSPDYLQEYLSWLPALPSADHALPSYEEEKRDLIINIETTRANPWEARLIMIGVLDPSKAKPEPVNIFTEREDETLQMFVEFFEGSPYTHLVGYNVAFDYRFLYALMQRYRVKAPQFMDTNLIDLMQQQKQVKHEYVFNYNSTGKLDQWAEYLLGKKPYAEQEQVWKWFEDGNLDEIANYNSRKLLNAYSLYVLDKLVKDELPASPSPAPTPKKEETPGAGTSAKAEAGEIEYITVQCPNCLQELKMPKTAESTECHICGEIVKKPSR